MEENADRLIELARLASTERDLHKFLTLISEINELLVMKKEPQRPKPSN
jgi:hypothetical protein